MNLSAVVCGRRLRPRADGGDGRLLGVLTGDEQPPEPLVPGGHGDRERPLDRPDRPVQGELPDGRGFRQLVRLDLAGGDQHPEGDRQVERAGVLPEIGGGQVDDGPPGRAVVAEVGERPLDPVDALPDDEFRQPDEDRLGQPGGDIDLDFDRGGIDADQCERAELREHYRSTPADEQWSCLVQA